MKAIQVRAAVLLMAAFLLGGCAPGGGSSGAATSPAAGVTAAPATGAATATAAATITIKNFDFGTPVTVAPGAVVMVTNMDSAAHTVTADQGSAFDVDVRGSGGTATFTAPSVPGTYPYHCTYHPNMHGTLKVK
jgi:plastocyanin